MATILEVKNLYKYYKDFPAVKNLSFSVDENEIFGLVGPNGAGKSTTLKIISTILSFAEGEISIAGIDFRHEADKIRHLISYLPEDAGAYKNLTGQEYLAFMAAIYTDSAREQKEFVEFARDLCGLKDRLKDKVKTYSKGMTRKLLLARAVMSRPRLAILDEPTSGLDVINAHAIRETIKKLAAGGMAVLLSSHNMLEIEFLTHRVAIMDQGEIKLIGTPAELKAESRAANLEEAFIAITQNR